MEQPYNGRNKSPTGHGRCRSRSRSRSRERSRNRSRSRSVESRVRRRSRSGSNESRRNGPRISHPRTLSNDHSKPTASKSSSKEAIRWDDPARLFVEEYKNQEKSVSKYIGPPNRFNVPPGKEWDGVDRSNGFEVDYFKRQASRARRKDLDYKYSVADM